MSLKKSNMQSRKVKNLIFYICMMALPIIQLGIMYFGVNINSILLAFKTFDYDNARYVYSGFDNFVQVWKDFTQSELIVRYALPNALIVFALHLFVTTPLGLIFSFYVYKKFPFSKTFRVILYLPSIIFFGSFSYYIC